MCNQAIDIKDLTAEDRRLLISEGYVYIDGHRYRPEMHLEVEIVDKNTGQIKEVK